MPANDDTAYEPLYVEEIFKSPLPFWLPVGRLNLLLIKDDVLYFAATNDSSFVRTYAIRRGGSHPVQLYEGARHDILDAHTNNIVLLEHSKGRAYIVAAGGNPADAGPTGTLAILALGGAEEAEAGTVFGLPGYKSCWGLDVSGDSVAVSSNSHRVGLYDLVAGDDGVALEPCRLLSGSHFDNIPSVSFGPAGGDEAQLLFSGSIDGSFCVYTRGNGLRICQKSICNGFSTNESSVDPKHWCWSVSSVADCPPKAVSSRDPVYSCLNQADPRKAGWLDCEKLAQAGVAAMESAAPNRKRPRSRMEPLPVYDDGDGGCEDPTAFDADEAAETEVRDADVAVHAFAGAELEPSCAVLPTLQEGYCEESAKECKTQHAAHFDRGGEGEDEHAVIVGLQETLHLYSLRRKDAHRPFVVAEEIQCVRPVLFEEEPVFLGAGKRIVKILKLPKFSALVVVQQGGGVAIVRLVKSPKLRMRLVVERMLSIGSAYITGIAMHFRECPVDKFRVEESYEIWLAQLDLSGQPRSLVWGFEISRRKPRIQDYQLV